MNKDKINQLKMKSNIHTVQVHTCESDIPKMLGVTLIKHTIDNETGERMQILKLNPSTFKGREMQSLQQHEETISEMIQLLGIEDYYISRVDKKTDSYTVDDFDKYSKINRVIVLLVDLVYGLGNRYQSIDPLTLDNLNIAAKSKYYEIEAYNKAVESCGKNLATNRLEVRSLWLLHKNKSYEQVIKEWHLKLDKALKAFDELQVLQNQALLKKYNQEKGVEVKSLWEFTRKYQHYIYTRKQLIDLYKQIGLNNAESTADNFKRKNKIEYFSRKDLKQYISKIKEADKFFLSSSTVLDIKRTA